MNDIETIKISVIVPVYNSKEFLKECIESIVNQTYTNLDIVLVDDGSNDGSEFMCDYYAEKDKRIRVVHKKNGGLVAARKTGIENAVGNYITFIDADDYIDLNTYETIVKHIGTEDIDMLAFGLVEEYSDYSKTILNRFEAKSYDKNEMIQYIVPNMLSYGSFFNFGILPNLVCKVIKRQFLENNMYQVSDEITIGEDVDATFQMMVNVTQLLILDYAPYHYRKHFGSMMWRKIEYNSIKLLESELKKAFSKSIYKEILQKQLKEYITFVSLLKCPKYVLGDCFEGKRIAIYGAGGFGQALYGEYCENVELWVDKSYKKYQDIDLPVLPVELLFDDKYEYDVVFIAILNVELCEKINKELISRGIERYIIYYDCD